MNREGSQGDGRSDYSALVRLANKWLQEPPHHQYECDILAHLFLIRNRVALLARNRGLDRLVY